MAAVTDTRSPAYRYFLRQLKSARKEAGLTQVEAAKALGVEQGQISRMETGERRVDIIEADAFATLYGKPLSYFVKPSQ